MWVFVVLNETHVWDHRGHREVYGSNKGFKGCGVYPDGIGHGNGLPGVVHI